MRIEQEIRESLTTCLPRSKSVESKRDGISDSCSSLSPQANNIESNGRTPSFQAAILQLEGLCFAFFYFLLIAFAICFEFGFAFG